MQILYVVHISSGGKKVCHFAGVIRAEVGNWYLSHYHLYVSLESYSRVLFGGSGNSGSASLRGPKEIIEFNPK